MIVDAWRSRPGLAGGIDKDGSRAAELLAIGFASVEFGTVTPQPEAGHNPGVAVLLAQLACLDRSEHNGSKIGISLGAGINTTADALAGEWLRGMHAAWAVADYLCFNLSARAYRPLLAAQHTALLCAAVATLVRERESLCRQTGRRVAVLLKLPLDAPGAHWPATLQAIAALGLDALLAVLPESGERLGALRQLASFCQGEPLLLAVGGLRTADDVRAVLAAGAEGVQVHSAFVEHGADCLPALLAGMLGGDAGSNRP